MASGNVHVTSWKVVPHPYRKSYSSWYSAVPSRGHILADQTGSFWIVWYVIGLLNHILIYSSQPFLCFKMSLLVENIVMWDSMKVEQILYDALDGGAGWGAAGRKAPIPKIHIILCQHETRVQGTQCNQLATKCLDVSSEGWYPDRELRVGLCCWGHLWQELDQFWW